MRACPSTLHRILVCAGITLLPGLSNAFQPLITDDTGTQGSGHHQLEFATSRDRASSNDDTTKTYNGNGVYTYGLTETLDVFASTSYASIHTRSTDRRVSGLKNTTVGAKWRFFESEETGTSLALRPELSIPVSAQHEQRGLGSGKVSGNLNLILTQEVPFGAVHANAVVGRDRFRNQNEHPENRTKRFSLAPVWEVNEQWTLALDLGTEFARANSQTTRTRFFELGTVYSLNKDLDLAIGAIRKTDNARPKVTTHTLTTGVTWRF